MTYKYKVVTAVLLHGTIHPSVAEAGAVEELNTLERWKEMRDDPEYRIVMWLAAQDELLCDRLSKIYPDDARQLVKLRQSGTAGRAPQQNSAQDTAQAQILRRN